MKHSELMQKKMTGANYVIIKSEHKTDKNISGVCWSQNVSRNFCASIRSIICRNCEIQQTILLKQKLATIAARVSAHMPVYFD